MQVVLVYFKLFRRNLLLKCVAAQNRKKTIKIPILGVQGRSRSLILMSIEKAYVTSY